MSRWLTPQMKLELDCRLWDVWAETPFDLRQLDGRLLAALFHYAYMTGYLDALTESEPGVLLRDHGYVVPKRSAAGGAVGKTVPASVRVPPSGQPAADANQGGHVSPIIDVQHRMVEVGRLRFGMKNSRNLPVKLKTWRMTSQDKQRLDAAAELWGGEVKPWDDHDGQWELLTEASELKIMLLPGQALSQWFELWGQRGEKKPVECLRRCDGQHEIYSDGPCKCPRDDDGRLEDDDNSCKPVTRLSVMLPELVGLGHWRVETAGWNALRELAGSTSLLEAASHAGQILPARLRLEERRGVKQGQTVKYVVPIIDVDVTIPQLMGGGSTPIGHTPLQLPAAPPISAEDAVAALEQTAQPKAKSARSAADLGPPIIEAATLVEPLATPLESPPNSAGEETAVTPTAPTADASPGAFTSTQTAPAETVQDAPVINDRQRRMLFAVGRESGVEDDDLRAVIKEVTGQESTKGIKTDQFEAVLTAVKAKQAVAS